MRAEPMRKIAAGVVGLSIVLSLVQGLEKTMHDVTLASDTYLGPESVLQDTIQCSRVMNDNRPSDQNHEQEQHAKVQDGETNNPSLSQFGLLQRVDRGTDLTTKSGWVISNVPKGK